MKISLLKKFALACTLVLATQFFAMAQEILTAEQAIQTALANNFGIKILENDRDIAKNNVSKAAVGAVPNLNFVSTLGGSNINTRQTFANGQEQNRNFASAINGSAGVQLAWTLWDGHRMTRSLERLDAQARLSDFQLQIAAENLSAEVLATFAEAVRQSQIIAATQRNLKFYDERIRLAQARVDAGTAGKPVLLQTQIDKNLQQSLLLQAENALAGLKISLNFLMRRQAEIAFGLPDSLFLNENLKLETELAAAEISNRQIRLAQMSEQVAQISIREMQAANRPQLNLNAQYNYARSQNQAGFLLSNQNLGLTAGLTFTYNIFDGKNNERLVENARLASESAKLRTSDGLENLKSQIALAFTQWQTARQTIALERSNIALVEQNLKIADDRFRLGGSDILPLREAQKSFEDAQIRLIDARHRAKLAEIRLFLLTGKL